MGCNYSLDEEEEEGEENVLTENKNSEYSHLPNVSELKDGNIENLFTIEKILGKGGTCRVMSVVKKKDQSKYAMKELLRDDAWNPKLFSQEIQILTTIKHKNILRYCEAYVGDKYFYLCTKLCTGGELFEKVKQLRHFSEKKASESLKVILEAIEHCHNHNIVHRDLKPENIVYDERSENANIIIIDFGDAIIVDNNQVYTDFVGTPYYLAPECIRHRFGWELKKSDMWAIGVIAYVLLTGKPPFWGQNNREILMRITKSPIHWPSSVPLSRACKNFIASLLQKEPHDRLSASEALQHVWIQREAQLNDEHLGDEVLIDIGKFLRASKLKKLLVNKLVTELTKEEQTTIIDAFRALDKNHDGYVDKNELSRYLVITGLSNEESEARAIELINAMDKDKDGRINLSEFMLGRTASRLTSDVEFIDREFNRLASDHNKASRTITTEELRKSFGNQLTEQQILDIVKEVDTNGDGNIDINEFRQAMKQQTIRTGINIDTNQFKE